MDMLTIVISSMKGGVTFSLEINYGKLSKNQPFLLYPNFCLADMRFLYESAFYPPFSMLGKRLDTEPLHHLLDIFYSYSSCYSHRDSKIALVSFLLFQANF